MLFLVSLCHSRENGNLFFSYLSLLDSHFRGNDRERGEVILLFQLLNIYYTILFSSLHFFFFFNYALYAKLSTLYAIKAYAIRPYFFKLAICNLLHITHHLLLSFSAPRQFYSIIATKPQIILRLFLPTLTKFYKFHKLKY